MIRVPRPVHIPRKPRFLATSINLALGSLLSLETMVSGGWETIAQNTPAKCKLLVRKLFKENYRCNRPRMWPQVVRPCCNQSEAWARRVCTRPLPFAQSRRISSWCTGFGGPKEAQCPYRIRLLLRPSTFWGILHEVCWRNPAWSGYGLSTLPLGRAWYQRRILHWH